MNFGGTLVRRSINQLHQKHLTTLEFPKILKMLARHASFSASKALALELQPSPYLTEVQGWQAETTEADHLLSVKVNIGVGGVRDVRPYLIRASRNLVLTTQELLEIRQTLISARQLRRTITRLADAYPGLADIAQRIEDCPGVVNDISQAISDHGDIKDKATPTLARIRRELNLAHERLVAKLNRIVASPQHSHYLQDALVTQRAGRYVIPLKAEFKGRIRGIVHDQSGSGATLFVEPLVTVDLNNKWRQLQLDEDEEIHKILATLSELVGGNEQFISHSVEAMAELDLAFAKAKFAQTLGAIEPILGDVTGQPPLKEETSQTTNSDNPRPEFKLIAASAPLA